MKSPVGNISPKLSLAMRLCTQLVGWLEGHRLKPIFVDDA
jgi:hypothetical protein